MSSAFCVFRSFLQTPYLVLVFVNTVTYLVSQVTCVLIDWASGGASLMTLKSPLPVALSERERQHLEAIACLYTSPYCDFIRAKIILLAAEGLSNDAIASRLDTPRQIVSK